MIAYTVVHHVPGRIRIEIPMLKRLSLPDLRKLSTIPTPSGVKGVRANPITGSLTIIYDPQSIDIVAYIARIASGSDLQTFLAH
ncbi:MAG: HMA2 domain-containing protein [Nitrospirota bacterium]